MTIEQNNLNAIKKGFPELYERLADNEVIETEDTVEKAELITTLTDFPAVDVQMKTGEKVRLNSLYSPETEAAIWADGRTNYAAANLLIFGLGNGCFANEIIRRRTANSHVVIYEPSAVVFRKAMEAVDFSGFFLTKGVRVIVENINEDMFGGVMEEMLTLENCEDYEFFFCPKLVQLFPESRKKFVERYADDGIARITSVKNNFRWLLHISPYNQLHNLKYLEANTVVPKLASVWEQDVPIICIGAGPSLKEEIETLRKIRDKAFLFAVDSAMPYLMQENLMPDAYICIEADKPMSFFEDERVRQIPLFAKVDTTHKLLDIHEGKKVFGWDQGFVEGVYDECHVPQSKYRYGANGATSLFSICKELGAKNVILLGQDMVYSEEKTSHVGNRDEGYKDDDIFLCENNEGKMVQSRLDWHRFLLWYANAIPTCKFEHVINVSKRGAKIDGTEVMSLCKAMELLGHEHSDFQSICDRAERTFRFAKKLDLGKFYQRCENELVQIKKLISIEPKADERKRFLIYSLLEMYEVADVDEDFRVSQKHGIETLSEYLSNCIKESRNG